jgi:hypothetical protein
MNQQTIQGTRAGVLPDGNLFCAISSVWFSARIGFALLETIT